MNPYLKGVNDYLDGADLSENPYPPYTEDHIQWCEGWLDEKYGEMYGR